MSSATFLGNCKKIQPQPQVRSGIVKSSEGLPHQGPDGGINSHRVLSIITLGMARGGIEYHACSLLICIAH